MFFKKEQINKKEIIKWGIAGGLAEICYCLLIALLLPWLTNNLQMPDSATLGFFFFLIILVFSVAVSGFFVFGYPAYLALQKSFRDAILTLLITFSTLLAGFVLLFIIIVIFFNS